MGCCALGALRPGPAVRLSLVSSAFILGWTTPTSAMRDVLITRRPFAASFTIVLKSHCRLDGALKKMATIG